MNQEVLLKEIRRKTGDKSLNDEISNVLNISYDAAHRRTSHKAKFSFEEAIELAKYYQISLDQFLGSENQLVARKTQTINTPEELLSYYDSTLQILNSLDLSKDTKIYYSAKDIPFFYTVSDSVLSRFKLYVWINLLNEKKGFIPFREFKTEQYSSKTSAFEDIYEKYYVVEIWNENTVSSILKQIRYYFDMDMIESKEVSLILNELKSLLQSIEHKIIANEGFEMYVNDMINPTNSFFIHSPKSSTLVVPYNMFGYLFINDTKTSEETMNYFEHQMKNSKSLSSTKERKTFFNQMYQKIETMENME